MNAMLGGLFRFIAGFGPWVLLAVFLFVLGVVLTMLGWAFGFSLNDVDVWLEAHGGFFHAAGKLVLRIVFGFFLLVFAFVAVSPFIALMTGRKVAERRTARVRRRELAEKPNWGCALAAIPAAWFCWIGAFGDY